MNAPAALAMVWVAFFGYWLIAALSVKKAVRTSSRWQRMGYRIVLIAGIYFVYRDPSLRYLLRPAARNVEEQVAGFVLCLAGLGFALWARLNLGRNWGQPMTLKEGHELVTSGPYRLVRHPIYTGILVAMLGSWLVAGPPWSAALLVSTAFFIYSARTEEGIMAQQFPELYPEYKKRTKALVPYVW